VIDYKTGGVPKKADVQFGFSPQLPLEAAIARAGGFTGVPAADVESLVYWRLTGGEPAGQENVLPLDATALADEAVAGLERLIVEFADPAMPYHARPDPEAQPRFSDYEHLARVKEWSDPTGAAETP
jgi:ATP-dependent helicase/nuclease subunit B